MQRYLVKDASAYSELKAGTVFQVPVQEGMRGIYLSAIATERCVVWYSSDPTMKGAIPVAVTEGGEIELEVYCSGEDNYLQLEMRDTGVFFYRDNLRPQEIVKTENAKSFLETTITPKPVGGSVAQIVSELDTRHKAKFAQLEAEIERLRKKSEA